MSAITYNAKHNRYQLRGINHLYLFNYVTSIEVKKHLGKFAVENEIDKFYSEAPVYIKRKIRVIEIEN